MELRTRTGANEMLDRPIHRACVVAGCPCGSVAARPAGQAPTADPRREPSRAAARGTSGEPVDVAWRTVGLPVA